MSSTADKCAGMKGKEVIKIATTVSYLAWFIKVAFDDKFPQGLRWGGNKDIQLHWGLGIFFFLLTSIKPAFFFFLNLYPNWKTLYSSSLQFNFKFYSQDPLRVALRSWLQISLSPAGYLERVYLSEPWIFHLWRYWLKILILSLTLLISWTFTCFLYLKIVSDVFPIGLECPEVFLLFGCPAFVEKEDALTSFRRHRTIFWRWNKFCWLRRICVLQITLLSLVLKEAYD